LGIGPHFWLIFVMLKQHVTTTTTTSFNGLFSRTIWVIWHQKGKPFWILMEQETMRWQWHQLDHVQIICTSHHASTPPLSFFTGWMPFFQPSHQHQSIEGKAACNKTNTKPMALFNAKKMSETVCGNRLMSILWHSMLLCVCFV